MARATAVTRRGTGIVACGASYTDVAIWQANTLVEVGIAAVKCKVITKAAGGAAITTLVHRLCHAVVRR